MLAQRGPVLLEHVPEFVGLSIDEIYTLREQRLFPRPKGELCGPYWYPAKQLAAYLWGLRNNSKLAEAVALAIGRHPFPGSPNSKPF